MSTRTRSRSRSRRMSVSSTVSASGASAAAASSSASVAAAALDSWTITSPMDAQRSMRSRAPSATTTGATAGVVFSPVPPPRSLLRRGHKRKDASLEEAAPDVAAVLNQHYERQRQRKAAKGSAAGGSASATPAAAAATGALGMPPPISVIIDASPSAAHSSSGAPCTPRSCGRRSPSAAAAKSKKQRRSAILAAAAAAVEVHAAVDADRAAAGAAASAGAVAAQSTSAVPATAPAASVSIPALCLKRALPFFFHMLSTRELLTMAAVSHLCRHVASQPIVWNSATVFTCAPVDLQRTALHPLLRNVKRLTIGQLHDPAPMRTTRDAHLRGALSRFTQLQVLTVRHLEIEHLYGLTEEFGGAGRRLLELHVLLDSSLAVCLRRRAAAQAVMDAEAAQTELEAQRVAAAAATSVPLSAADSDAMVDVAASPALDNASSVLSINGLIAASSSALPPPPSVLLSPPSRLASAASSGSAGGGGARRLPSLYSFISLLSLLPNLCVLTWRPLNASDFDRPNLALKSLHSLRIRHPLLRLPGEAGTGTGAIDSAWTETDRDADADPETVAAAQAINELGLLDLSPDGGATSSGSVHGPLSPDASHDSAIFLPDKSREQIAFLRALPSLQLLDWPGWSLANLKALCAPLPDGNGGAAGSGTVTPWSAAPSPVPLPATPGSLQAAVNAALCAMPAGLLHATPPHRRERRNPSPPLRTLFLCHDPVSDAHLHCLAQLHCLTSLSLAICAHTLTDAGLQSLCSLERLRHLELRGVVRDPSALHPCADPTRLSPLSIVLPASHGGPVAPLAPSPATQPNDASAADATAPLVAASDDDEEGEAPLVGFLRQESVVSYQSLRLSVAAASAAAAATTAVVSACAAGEGDSITPNRCIVGHHDHPPDECCGGDGSGGDAGGAVSAQQLSLCRASSDPCGLSSSSDRVAATASSSSSSSSSSFRDLEVVRLASLCSLRSLLLDGVDLGREGLHILFHSLRHLRELRLRRMSLASLHPVACLRRLTLLDVDRCTDMRGTALAAALRSLTHLRSVSVRRCAGIGSDALQALVDERAAAIGTPTGLSAPNAAAAAAAIVPRQWPDLVHVEFEPALSAEASLVSAADVAALGHAH